jgi:small subunit ribosomal protein S8
MSITTTDPIADMLTRIRNAIAVRRSEVRLPHSKSKEAIARLLVDTKYLSNIQVDEAVVGKTLVLTINEPNENARITEIVRVSTPGRRHYTKSVNIPTVKRGRGVVVISTSKGLMTGSVAKQQGLGGEIICKVY